MTLSNEQRAHDYALTILLALRDDKIEMNKSKGTEDQPIDVFEIYIDVYETTLKKLNNLLSD